LVEEGYVTGWDDPRMPTIAGLRRLGYTPEAIRDFSDRIGVAKSNSVVDIALLEHCVRDDLNKRAERRMVVLDPLKVIIDNYPDDLVEELDADNNPENPDAGTRKIPFSKVIYIEREDFREEAPRKWFRLAPGKEVRLKHAYYITCTEVIKNDQGEVVELHCTYDPQSRGGWTQDGRKVKGTLHWVSAAHAVPIEVRLYERLFLKENPEDVEEGQDFTANINPNSLQVIKHALAEPDLKNAHPGAHFQFLRKGYFVADLKDHSAEHPVFNRTVTLRDSWAKIEKKLNG
jgi:glutaminyl-tRNA synthetase